MSGNSVQISHVTNQKINNGLLLVNNFLFAAMLVCPMIPGAARYFASPYLCFCIILILAFLNYRLYKTFGVLSAVAPSLAACECGWKFKSRVIAWAALIPAVILVGVGPVSNPSAFAVDKFTRVFGMGVINDYSVTKRVHYFYFALIVYGLLIFNFYLNIILSLRNNLNSKIRRLGKFADTLLFVGWSFLLVCVYRQFSSHYSYDLTLYLLKSFLIFMIPAFYLWETGKLKVQDVRIMLSLAMLALVISVNIVVFFDTRDLGRFSDILTIVLLVSVLFFAANKISGVFDDKFLYSRLIAISLIWSITIIFFSLAFEFSNILVLKTGRFLDIGKFSHGVFYTLCWLSLGWFCFVKKLVSRKAAFLAMSAAVLGISLIIAQPSLIISSRMDIYESANYAVPLSDFFNFGKIPLFENFPGHHLSMIISSVLYGSLTSDYRGALFAPWYAWLHSAAIVLILYCFIKMLSNRLIAFSLAILLPYMFKFNSYYGIGLVSLLPFVLYIRTLKKRYLALTVFLSLFIVAYRLDIGFSFLAAILCSSLCLRIFYGRKILFRTVKYFALGGAAVFVLFLVICLIKDINPLFRIQQYLAITSSNDQWGYNWLGDTEKSSYSFFYYVVPVLSLSCFAVAVICRKKFTAAQFAVLLCLLFAYYANIPRILVRHSLAEYFDSLISIWIWTMMPALPFLLSRMFSSRSLFILAQAAFILVISLSFNNTTLYDNSPLQNSISRAELLSGQSRPDVRKRDVSFVFNRGSRVIYDENGSESLIYSSQIKALADYLLSSDETYLDFTNQSAAYAWSGREDPVYVVQPPSMLSGEKSQVLFIKEVESRLEKIPMTIMPTDKNWYITMILDGINNNIRHYLVAEWIYKNYRPLVKYNDYSSVWVLNSRYEEFYDKIKKALEFHNRFDTVRNSYCHNCSVKITNDGLLIQPTGPDPFLMGFEKLIYADQSKSFANLTINLANDNDDNYQIFFTSDKVVSYQEKYSMLAHSISPKTRFFDFTRLKDAGQINSLRLDVPESGNTLIKSVFTSSLPLQMLIDWGYDNFVSKPAGVAPGAEYISAAHNYNVEFLPYIWGQFDLKNAASHSDLAGVVMHENLYSWNYSGKERRPAYLRLDLSLTKDSLKNTNASAVTLGNIEDGKFSPLNRFRFRLMEGKKVYLFRISSDYYWSIGKLNAASLDPNLRGSVASVRIIEGD